MSALPLGYCQQCGRDEMNLGACYHCPTCGEQVEMDNCDGEIIDGPTVGYLGTTQGFKCESCMEWTHTACGDEKQSLCSPCFADFGVV